MDLEMIRLMLATVLALKATVATCRELPQWEIGVGLFPSTFPAYRGSQAQQNYLLPFPYLVYRGDYLRLDREGLRARLFNTDRVQFNISVNASTSASSDKSNVRKGMPDLDPTIEIGPSLNILLAKWADKHSLKLKLPVRSVIALQLDGAEQAGWIFNPHLKLESNNLFGGWNVGLNVGPLFGTRKYHAYYYAVEPEYATATRLAYSPSAGYSGIQMQASMSRRINRMWMGGFVRYDNLSGTRFEGSPLFETDHSLMAGFAIAWIFKQSSKTSLESSEAKESESLNFSQ